MSPSPLSRGARRVRFGVSLALSSALLLACGGNPAGTQTGSGAANLPPQTNPAVKDGDKDKKAQEGPKRTIAGSVTDALTGEPVAKAVMYIEGIANTVASTPIPPAAPDARDPVEGGGGGPTQLAQAAPEATEASADPALGAPTLDDPALDPAASPDPFAVPSPAGSPAPGAAASAAPAGEAPKNAKDKKDADKKAEAPTPAGTPFPLTEVKVDGKGKYEVKDLPEGTYSLTFWAPGYQAQTFQGKLREAMDVQLLPQALPKDKLQALKGVVRQASNDPAGNVHVEATSYKAQVPSAQGTSDDAGNFALDGLLPGNYAVAAWTTNLEGEINTFAMVKEVPVAVGREKRTVSPTLVLRAVTAPVLLAGTVEGTVKEEEAAKDQAAPAAEKKPVDGVRPRLIRAYVRAGEGEFPVASAAIGKDGYFRLRLPQLPEGVSYHLVASGVSESGQTVYVHRHGVTKSDPKIAIQLPDAPGGITVTEPGTGPDFSWEPVSSDVSAYRVTLESIGQDADTLWEGWTTGTSLQLPNSPAFKLLKEGESYRYSLTAIKLGEDGKLDLNELSSQPWAFSGLTRPATYEVQRLKPGQKSVQAAPAQPVKPGAPAAKPGPAGPAKPAVPPSADASKNKRAKPMSDL